MSKIVYRSKDKEAVKQHLERFVLPADPDAEMKKDGDEWTITANAIIGSKPVVIEKS